MTKSFTNLSNEELLNELQKNLEENDLLFQEIVNRKEKGNLTLPTDLLDKAS